MRFFYLLLLLLSVVARIVAAFSSIEFAESGDKVLGVNAHIFATGWAIFWTLVLLFPVVKAEAIQQSSGGVQYRQYEYGRDIDGGKHFDLKTWDPTDPTIYGTHADPINGPSGPQ